MGTTMNRRTYEKMVFEDIEWLLKQPRTVERIHIEQVLRDSPRRLYPTATADGREDWPPSCPR